MKKETTVPQTQKTIEALWRLEKIILRELDFNSVVEAVVNGLLDELGYLDLGYKIIVLTLVNDDKKVLERVSLSQTDEAARALAASAVPFHDIEIPLSASNNLLIKTINQKRPHVTTYWPELFVPVLSDEEALRNQKAAGINTSLTYPVVVRGVVIGVLIFSMTKKETEVSEEERDLLNGFTDIVGLAVQNARLHTTLKDTAAKLRKANSRLKELDQAKDDFISMASHQLRTPLTSIKGYLSMIVEGDFGPIPPKQRNVVDMAYHSASRMVYLISDLLNVSRLSTGKFVIEPTPTQLDDVIEQEINQLKRTFATKNQKIKTTIAKDFPTVLLDETKTRQVIMNFMDNASYYTPIGGEIEVKLELHKDSFEFKVIDNGIGVPKSEQQKLFKKFFRATNAKKARPDGNGLGLYMAQQVIAGQGGKIIFESVEGKGSTFGFRFALAIVGASKKRKTKK